MKKEVKLRINVPSDVKKGVYSNIASFNHTPNEFVFDFVFAMQNEGDVVSRVITNPQHAKAILLALAENIQKYEDKFGEIEPPSEKKDGAATIH